MNSSGRLPSVDWSDARDRGAEPRAHRLGGDPDRPRHPAERGAADDEGRDRVGVGVVQDAADDREREHRRRDRERAGHERPGLTNPIRSYIASSVGADAARAFSAPTASRRSSSPSSARSSR